MNKATTRELLDTIQNMTTKLNRIGGRIQLASYRAPDDSDVQAIPDELTQVSNLLDYLGCRISETINGPYLIAEYVDGRDGVVLTGYEPMDYHDAAETTENLNLLRGHEPVPYLAPFPLADTEDERWTVVLTGEDGQIKHDTNSLALPCSQGYQQARILAENMNLALHVTDPNSLDSYGVATYETVFGGVAMTYPLTTIECACISCGLDFEAEGRYERCSFEDNDFDFVPTPSCPDCGREKPVYDAEDVDRCRVCNKPIASAELCGDCAEGNDPFFTSKYKEVRF